MGSEESKLSGDDNHGESRKRKRNSQWDISDDEETDLEEIEKKARLTIEEALSKRKIRFCPSCKVRATKGPGCDHITCVCGAEFCFKCGSGFCDGGCRRRKRRGPMSTVRNVCKQLKKRHPQLTFRQCCRIVATSWTKEHEALESERCDNDSECSGEE